MVLTRVTDAEFMAFTQLVYLIDMYCNVFISTVLHSVFYILTNFIFDL